MDLALLLDPNTTQHSISVASTSTGAIRFRTIAPSLTCVSTSSTYCAIPPISSASRPSRGVPPYHSNLGQRSDVPAPAGQQRFLPQESPGSNESPPIPEEGPPKQSKWSPEEDELVVTLRGQGMKWDDIGKRLHERSSGSCRLRYQNYLRKRVEWDEENKNKLAWLYARYVARTHLQWPLAIATIRTRPLTVDCRFRDQMWQKVAIEMNIPWRSAESMHWQLGERDMSARADEFTLPPTIKFTGSPRLAPGLLISAPPSQPLDARRSDLKRLKRREQGEQFAKKRFRKGK
jgi:hypothetical protein